MDRKAFVKLLQETAKTNIFTKAEIRDAAEENDFTDYKKALKTWRVSNNRFDISRFVPLRKGATIPSAETETPLDDTVSETSKLAPAVMDFLQYVPEKADDYVSWGNHNTVKAIIKSNKFFPIFITGQSGNGKTLTVHQVCAQLKREIIRVNITSETDEDDLLGGFRLEEGKTVWHNGPIVEAMLRGSMVLLDEIDLASYKIMCLQPILEGNPIYLKKIGKMIHPAPGFNIVATANTKGQGSDSGRYVGTGVLNEAFLDRFAVTFQQNYAGEAVEKNILKKRMELIELKVDEDFIEKLVKWGQKIRKTSDDDGCDDLISTRRLLNIIDAYQIFDDKKAAIKHCIERFDEHTRTTFWDLYSKIDADMVDDSEMTEEEKKKAAEKAAKDDDDSNVVTF